MQFQNGCVIFYTKCVIPNKIGVIDEKIYHGSKTYNFSILTHQINHSEAKNIKN